MNTKYNNENVDKHNRNSITISTNVDLNFIFKFNIQVFQVVFDIKLNS